MTKLAGQVTLVAKIFLFVFA